MALIRVTEEVLEQTGVEGIIASYFNDANNNLVISENLISFNTIVDLKQTVESFTSLTSATGTVEHNYTNGALFVHTTVSGSFTPNFTNVPSDNDKATVVSLIIYQGSTAYMPTAIQIEGNSETINWSEGIIPSGSANKIDVVSFTLLRSSDSWSVLGQVGSFG